MTCVLGAHRGQADPTTNTAGGRGGRADAAVGAHAGAQPVPGGLPSPSPAGGSDARGESVRPSFVEVPNTSRATSCTCASARAIIRDTGVNASR